MAEPRIDEIGYWSELKLEIVKKYAAAYSKILTNQSGRSGRTFSHAYIDAFAGAGVHLSRTTGVMVPGSPLNALAVDPPFDDFYLIDLDAARVEGLQSMIGNRRDVHYYRGNCNEILQREVFPQVRWEDFRRALCLLDPYGLHLNWEVIQTAGQMKTIDMFLNFPTADMNRNVLWHAPQRVDPGQVERMNAFWGDESWRTVVYSTEENLFGWEEKVGGNKQVVDAFCQRLHDVAGFKHVSAPLPMRNSLGAIVYYLVFASQRPVATSIVKEIFHKYRDRTGA